MFSRRFESSPFHHTTMLPPQKQNSSEFGAWHRRSSTPGACQHHASTDRAAMARRILCLLAVCAALFSSPPAYPRVIDPRHTPHPLGFPCLIESLLPSLD